MLERLLYRLSRLQYEYWPLWVKIPYCVTFPISAPILMLSMMAATFAFGLVLAIACLIMIPFFLLVEHDPRLSST